MEKITLEKVDMVRDRTKVTYAKAKEALEACDGDVLEALIYIEKNSENKTEESFAEFKNDFKNAISIGELKAWFKELIAKGNVTRIKIKKDEEELVDIPVNAGIAAGVIAVIIPPILAAGVITAIATQITIEITKEDGTVEVVNKYVSKVTDKVKAKATDFADKMKNKVNEENMGYNDNYTKSSKSQDDGVVYTYTVNFDNETEMKNEDSKDIE
ncbi:MAG: DUF4342 domain-containing protein [Clostridium butyricum]|nr:DUF4342 domain-containing protein [Clostridium butyricum]